MSDLRYPTWQEPVRLAVVELDPSKIEAAFRRAFEAIEDRRSKLHDNPDHHEERLALEDAANMLNALVPPKPTFVMKKEAR